MNAEIHLRIDRASGLLCDVWVTSTEKESSVCGRWQTTARTLTTSRIVPKADSFSRSHYVTYAEKAELDLYHQCRYATNDVRRGLAVADRAKIRLAHIFGNLKTHVRLREFELAKVTAILGAGWWRRASSVPNLTFFAGIIRAVAKAAVTPRESIESPYYDEIGVGNES